MKYLLIVKLCKLNLLIMLFLCIIDYYYNIIILIITRRVKGYTRFVGKYVTGRRKNWQTSKKTQRSWSCTLYKSRGCPPHSSGS